VQKKEKQGKQEKLAEEMKDTLQRLQAEFENYTKRLEKEKKEFIKFASASTIKELLPVLDSFDSAIEKIEGKEKVEKEEALHGLIELRKQFFAVMEKEGAKKMETIGKQFDPEFQECIMKEHQEGKEDGIVLEEIQKGYTINGMVLRTAKVKINMRGGE